MLLFIVFQLSSGGAAAQADTGQEIGCIIMFQLLQPPLPSDNIASKHSAHWRSLEHVMILAKMDKFGQKGLSLQCFIYILRVLASIQQQKARNATANCHTGLRTIFISLPCLFPPVSRLPPEFHIKKCVRG